MSKPDSQTEIRDVNDVLSSIRKLVSDEAQVRAEDNVASDIRDVLVLTSSQRVEQRSEPAEDNVSAMDEATLRAMVSEIVREELQGDLGDRITRNARKIIRREISRALSENLAD